ncbi:protoheme IX farnesyltransferase [bacterium]|nr:protoheme IX farnesyltransferase [bacterium]
MPFKHLIKDYNELTKPGITRMQLITVSIGFILGGVGLKHGMLLYIPLLIGTYCVAAGAGALNHAVEKEFDSQMDRTRSRPLPRQSVNRLSVFLFGIGLVGLGAAIHFIWINPLTAGLSATTVFLYICVYTPLKRVTWVNTFVGAIPGAMPILGGWSAGTGTLHSGAWVLFAIMFAWQIPHFYALALMYETDYKSGGMVMLPGVEDGHNRTYRQIIIYTVLLYITSIMPVFIGLSGPLYLFGMTVLGIMMTVAALRLIRRKDLKSARVLFFASIIYLPMWFGLVILDFFLTIA